MRSTDSLRALHQITAYQWGMVTSAQAGALGVTRLHLSRLAEEGLLERLAHGVYKDGGTPEDASDPLRAAWLSVNPTRLPHQRDADRAAEVFLAGPSAARLHGIGDLWDHQVDFVTARRRQSQRPEIRYRRRVLHPQDVTTVGGLPVMTVERTIADLVEEIGDLSLVSDALRDAWRKGPIDVERLRELLCPLAQRHGLKRGDGSGLLDKLMLGAGIQEHHA